MYCFEFCRNYFVVGKCYLMCKVMMGLRFINEVGFVEYFGFGGDLCGVYDMIVELKYLNYIVSILWNCFKFEFYFFNILD